MEHMITWNKLSYFSFILPSMVQTHLTRAFFFIYLFSLSYVTQQEKYILYKDCHNVYLIQRLSQCWSCKNTFNLANRDTPDFI